MQSCHRSCPRRVSEGFLSLIVLPILLGKIKDRLHIEQVHEQVHGKNEMKRSVVIYVHELFLPLARVESVSVESSG